MYSFDQFSRSDSVLSRTAVLSATVLSLLALVLLTTNHSKQTSPRIATSAMSDHRTQPHVIEAYGKLPMAFETNQGQSDEQVKFLARGSGYSLFLTSTEAVLSLSAVQHSDSEVTALHSSSADRILSALKNAKSHAAGPEKSPTTIQTVLRMKLVDANPAPQAAGLEELPGKTNYFIGNDPSKWRTNVPNYTKVAYKDVYPGVDLVYYGNQRQLEYDFVVAPGC